MIESPSERDRTEGTEETLGGEEFLANRRLRRSRNLVIPGDPRRGIHAVCIGPGLGFISPYKSSPRTGYPPWEMGSRRLWSHCVIRARNSTGVGDRFLPSFLPPCLRGLPSDRAQFRGYDSAYISRLGQALTLHTRRTQQSTESRFRFAILAVPLAPLLSSAATDRSKCQGDEHLIIKSFFF